MAWLELARICGGTEKGFTAAFLFVWAEQCLVFYVGCFGIEDASVAAVLKLAVQIDAFGIG